MKAITRYIYGREEVLEISDMTKPTPKKNEVLVKVHASTVSRTDQGGLTGKPYAIRLFIGFTKPRDVITGTDFAGIIEAVGEEVKNFEVGDKVFGFDDEGCKSHAQYMCFKAKKGIVKMPDRFSYEEAATCVEGAHYVFNFLNKVKLPENARVLLNGSTGGIGSAALQILKSKGYYVTAVCNTKNLNLIKSLGADKIYNYETEDFTKDEERYDLVFDAVGKSRFPLTKHLLKDKGYYVSSELGKNWENIYLPLLTKFSKKQVKFPIPTNIKRSLTCVKELMEQNKYQAVIDKTYQMDDARNAFAHMLTGEKTGSVVLKIDQ